MKLSSKAFTAMMPLLCAVPGKSQTVWYGAELGVNKSTQLFFDPTHAADGETQYNSLTGMNIGLAAGGDHLFHNKLPDFFSYEARLAFSTKGSIMPGQVSGQTDINGSSTMSVDQIRLKNRLSYVTLDLLVQKKLFTSKGKTSLALNLGIGNNFLVASNIRSSSYDPVMLSYPYNQYKTGHLHAYNASWILGTELSIAGQFNIFIETNKGFSSVYKSSDLVVKDWSWTFGCIVKLRQLKYGSPAS